MRSGAPGLGDGRGDAAGDSVGVAVPLAGMDGDIVDEDAGTDGAAVSVACGLGAGAAAQLSTANDMIKAVPSITISARWSASEAGRDVVAMSQTVASAWNRGGRSLSRCRAGTMARPAGLEPTAFCSGGRRSIR